MESAGLRDGIDRGLTRIARAFAIVCAILPTPRRRPPPPTHERDPMNDRADDLLRPTRTTPYAYRGSAQERLVFATPAADAVAAEVAAVGAERVFVVSGRSLGRLVEGPLQRIERALGTRHAGTFARMAAHTPREDVLTVIDALRAARADALVAIGGGSVIDGCKAAAIGLWAGVHDVAGFDRLVSAERREVSVVVPADALRVIAVSTTLSAADFTASAGLTDSATRSKQSIVHRLLVPRVAILDPEATLDTPLGLLLSTGMRAVDHAVESYCAPSANPATAIHSLAGLRLLYDALPAIARDPHATGPRAEAQLGMWQAITAAGAGAGSGASHGIGYALGATFDVAHGHTSCVMLPAVLKWNAAVNADRQAALSAAMGRPDVAAGELVGALVKALGQPSTLRELGIDRDQFEEIARRALGYQPVRTNPRPIRSEEDVLQILELAW